MVWWNMEKATHVTFRQFRWRKVLPANPEDGKSTTLTRGAIITIAGSETRDFLPTGIEGYFRHIE
jgi:hypothetical protein